MSPDARLSRLGKAKHRVAGAREALVELDHRLADPGHGARQLLERLNDLAAGSDVFEAARHVEPGGGEHLAAPRLGPQVEQIRGDAVERHPQLGREAALQRARVEAGEIRVARLPRQIAQPRHDPRPVEDLARQRLRARVVERHQRQPPAGVAGRHPVEQVDVVLDDLRVDRLAGEVDDAGAWVAEPDEGEEQPLLVRRDAADLLQLVGVERQRRHDDRGVESSAGALDELPDRQQLVARGILEAGRAAATAHASQSAGLHRIVHGA